MAGAKDTIIRYVYAVTGDQALADTAGLLVKMADGGKLADSEAIELAGTLKKLSSTSDQLNDTLGKKAALAETAAQLKAARAAAAQLATEFDRTDTSSKKINAAFAASDKALADLTAKYNQQAVALTKSESALQKAGVDTANLAAASEKLGAESLSVATQLVAQGKAASDAANRSQALSAVGAKIGAAFQSAREGVNAFASGLLRITGIAGAVTSALGAISIGRLFGAAVTSAKDFESALSEVKAVSGATADELNQMRVAAENAAKTTKFSATDAVGALTELARASGSAKDAISELGPTLSLAQGAGLGVAETATILTTALTQFGLSATDATRVADLFAREANSTNDNVQGLGLSLSYVAPLAKQLGLTIEQTTATLGALAEQGFRGERAGTALRNVFSQLLDPTSQFRAALTGLGISGNDFTSIITKLAAAGEKGKQALLSLDSEARPAIQALVSSGGAGIKRLTEDFKSAAGEAERTSKTMGENFAGASSRLANAFDALRRALVDPILAPLSKQLDGAAAKVRAFADSPDFARIQTAVKDFATKATQAIIDFVGNIDFTAVSRSIESFGNTASSFFSDFKSKADSLGSGVSVLTNTLGAAFNGIKGIVFSAAAAVTGGFSVMAKGAITAAEVSARLTGTFGKLKPLFDELKISAGGLGAVAEDFGKRAVASFKDIGANAEGLASAFDKTAAHASAAATAVDSVSSAERVAQATKLTQAYLDLPPAIQAFVEPLLRAAGVFDTVDAAAKRAGPAIDQTGSALDRARAQASNAYNAVARFAGAGDTTSDAYLRAKAALDAANGSVAKLTGESQAAAAGATALANAQAKLGATQAQLSQSATTASKDLDTIYQSFLKGTSAVEDVRAAFAQYAQALRASVANSDEWQKSAVEDAIAVKAAILGIPAAFQQIEPATQRAAENFHSIVAPLKEAIDTSTTASRAIAAAGEAAKEAGGTISGALGPALTQLSANMSEFGQVSERAALEYNKLVEALFNGAGAFSAQATADGTGIIRFGEAVVQAAALVRKGIEDEQESVAALTSSFQNMSEASIEAMARQEGGIAKVEARLRAEAEAVRLGNTEFKYLNQSDLSGLTSALDAAASKVEALRQRTMDAEQALEDYGRSLDEQILQAQGNQKGAEDARFQAELERLRKQAAEGNALDSQAYQEAVKKATELHQLKLKQLEQEAAERRKQDEEAAKRSGSGSGSGNGLPGSPDTPPPPTPTPPAPTPPPAHAAAGGISVTINVDGFLPSSPKDLDAFARIIRKELERIGGLKF